MPNQQTKKDILWLILSFVIATVVMAQAYWIIIGNTALDIHMHDTYVVKSPLVTLMSFALPCLSLIFLTILINEIRHRFRRNRPLVVVIAIGLLLLIAGPYLSIKFICLSVPPRVFSAFMQFVIYPCLFIVCYRLWVNRTNKVKS